MNQQDAKKNRQQQRKRHGGRVRAIGYTLLGAVVVLSIVTVIVLGLVVGSGGRGSESGAFGVGAEAPDFMVRTTSWSGGKEFVLSQHRGTPVAIYAVAGWCATCIPETQAWANIQRDLGYKITVLIFSADPSETDQSLLRFKEAAGGGDHLWAVDKDGVLTSALNILSLDTTVLIDAQGKIAYRDGAPTSEAKLRDEVAKLTGSAGGAQPQASKASSS